MKRVMMVIFVALTGCIEENNVNQGDLAGAWQVFWLVDNESLTGTLVLKTNSYGYLDIPNQPESLLISEKTNMDFKWAKNYGNLTLTRLDNNLELQYEILEENQDMLYMTFTDEVYVKLVRLNE